MPRLVDPQLSPDGKTVAYMLATADWGQDRLVYHLWRQSAGAAAIALTTGAPGDIPGATRWSPDGSSIAFLRGGQLWLVPAAGGNARAITKHATGITNNPGPIWSTDGRTIYFVATDPQTPEERERDRLKDDLVSFEENYRMRHLWSVDVADGRETQLTRGALTVASFRLSRDGTKIALERATTPYVDDAHLGEVWVMDASGANARQITRNNVEENQPELSPDNSQVLFLANANAKFEADYNGALFLVPASGGTPKLAAPDFPYAVDQASWAPDGKTILLVANMGVHSEIFSLDPATGSSKQLTEGRHFIVPTWAVVPSAGKMLIQFDEPDRYGDAWTMPIAANEGPSRVTGAFDGFTQRYAIPRQEKVTWKSNDGTTIEGVLMYPNNYQAGTRYPLVVQLHGGPEESDKFGAGAGLLLNYFPVLTGKGWFVFRPNYRGSTGYGNAFLRDVIPGYFRNMQLDVLSGVDALVKQDLVDTDRVVVMGWSAGGHLTNKLVTITNRFKAASSGAGASDWISFFAQSDRRDDRVAWFGGTPWQKNAPFALLWSASPLKDAANVKTPTRFFVGENDTRVPKEQSIEMYRALKSHNVPTALDIAPREGHLWNELRHQISKANAELAWFYEYALHTPYTPERAPGLP